MCIFYTHDDDIHTSAIKKKNSDEKQKEDISNLIFNATEWRRERTKAATVSNFFSTLFLCGFVVVAVFLHFMCCNVSSTEWENFTE